MNPRTKITGLLFAAILLLPAQFASAQTILEQAAAVHGIAVQTKQVRLARIALNRLSLIDRSAERDRRPTEDELEPIITTAEQNPRQIIPLAHGLIKNITGRPDREDLGSGSEAVRSRAWRDRSTWAPGARSRRGGGTLVTASAKLTLAAC